MSDLANVIARLGLKVEAVFVPFGQSRNAKADAKPSDRSLNWKVTLRRYDLDANTRQPTSYSRDILWADYQAGIAHCPSYKRLKCDGMRWTLEQSEAIEYETEKGKAAPRRASMPIGGKAIEPNAVDVIYSLVRDSDVLDYGTFEDWASEFGYDSDSRKAESIYRSCLEIALKLRNGIGETNLSALREAAAEY